MKFGYVRVSTRDQNLERQLDSLTKAGCEVICQEKVSWASHPARAGAVADAAAHRRHDPHLQARPAGALVAPLMKVVGDLQLGVGLVSLTDAINTTSSQDRLVSNLFASLAESELIRERTHIGLASARARSRIGGTSRKSGAHGYHRRDALPRAATRRH